MITSITIAVVLAFCVGFSLTAILTGLGLVKGWIKVISVEQKYFDKIVSLYDNDARNKETHKKVAELVNSYLDETRRAELKKFVRYSR